MKYVLAGSGHIAGVVNPPAKPKYQYWSGPAPDRRRRRGLDGEGDRAPRLLVAGLARLDQSATNGKTVPARAIGGGKLTPIEDAPGSYVRFEELDAERNGAPHDTSFTGTFR